MSKHLNTNKQFMIGNGILAFAVIFIVVIFVYMSFRLKDNQPTEFNETYTIVLESGFQDETVEVHLNDSILFKGKITIPQKTFNVKRAAEQSALIIVNTANQKLNIFNLAPKGGTYRFDNENGEITLRDEE